MPSMQRPITVLGDEDPDARIRREWGANLDEHLNILGISRKELVHRLAQVGCEVTVRAVGQWITGETAPRPSIQAATAHVLRVPSRSLWPLVHYPSERRAERQPQQVDPPAAGAA